MRLPSLFEVLNVIVWLVCFFGFIYQAGGLLEMFLAFPFTVTIIEQVRQNIRFPAVTICTDAWINNSRLCDYYPNVCTPAAQKITVGVYHFQFEPKMRLKSAYQPRELFKCTMRSTTSSCSSFNCIELMKLTYFRHPIMMCYTLDALHWAPQNHTFRRCRVPWTWELSLKASWSNNMTMVFQNVVNIPLLVHGAEIVPPDKLSSISIKPGISYAVSVTQQMVRRLAWPYGSRCSDYKKRGKMKQFFGYLTQDLCIQQCLIEEQQKTCGCIEHVHEFGGYFIYQTCNVEQSLECMTLMPNGTRDNCMRKCGPPCEETIYDVRLASLGEEKKTAGKNSFSVSLKFASDAQKILEYQPKLSILETYGYIGGYVGIWLGLSFYRALQAVALIVQKIKERRSNKING